MPRCTTSLDHFDCVTDTELLKIISGMNKATWSSDPFPTILLMSHLHVILPIIQHIANDLKYMSDHRVLSDFL